MQQLDPSVFKRWYTIYPCYMNALLSIQGGRRLPREKCVPNPQLPELSHCLSFLKLKHVVEPGKSHPRDWGHPGRVKLELYDELGNAKNPEILTKKQAILKMLEVFPKLKSREKQPPMAVIDEMLSKKKELIEKDRKEKQKVALKGGAGTVAKKKKDKKKK
ncbi:hypothetical protein FGO68_gene7943 [Halteria grandinella]|uniref:Signal recognition particle 19 kDa protein n=1 Tax=Halteria grandinella TaxID=5974 RepID=A0A8J8SZ51_HALGN|nr:hypothetical protein FGO68_gene7943 [Halteria grandinella]